MVGSKIIEEMHIPTMKTVPNFALFWHFFDVWKEKNILQTASSQKKQGEIWIAAAAAAAADATTKGGWFNVTAVHFNIGAI